MNPGILLIRADASIATGTGHVMRCLALAQAWQDAGGTAAIAMAESTPAIEQKLRAEAVEVVAIDAAAGTAEDARATAAIAERRQAAWVVVDGYRFGADYQNALKARRLRILFVDDGGYAKKYSADIVLNQNVHAAERLYEARAPGTRLLLGSRYTMLRREFAAWRDWTRQIPAIARHLLVTMGGSDPDNFTLRVIEALRAPELKALETVIVVGGSNPHLDLLQAAIASGKSSVRLVQNVENMPELMAWADLAVSAAGTTCWEMCLLGLPALIVDLAENQLPVAKRLDELGVARYIGNSRTSSSEMVTRELSGLLGAPEERKAMSGVGRDLVDGRGASRVCGAMVRHTVKLRRAKESDCRLLFEWVNDPAVRAASLTRKTVEWGEHVGWFRSRMSDPGYMILIAENDAGQAIGQVRIERRPDGEGVIDVSIADGFRGAGYSSPLTHAGVQEAFCSMDISKVHAFIRRENSASARMVENAGFESVGEIILKGESLFHYVKERPTAAKGNAR